MPKLTIEVQYEEESAHVVHIKVDGEPIGCIQAFKLEANEKEVDLEAVFPDADPGWANAEKLHKLRFARVSIAELVAEKK